MSSKIDIEINGVKLEVEVDGEAPEPSNGIAGGFWITAVRSLDRYYYGDIWPIIRVFAGVEDEILAAIDKEAERRREP